MSKLLRALAAALGVLLIATGLWKFQNISATDELREVRNRETSEAVKRLQETTADLIKQVAAQRKQLAETTAAELKHIREEHLPPEQSTFLWPIGWQKVELVCPTSRYTKKCRTPGYFEEHPGWEPVP